MTKIFKKLLYIAIAAAATVFTGTTALANSFEASKPQYSVAINSPSAVFNGETVQINAPILAFGKTYVDLY